MTVRESGGAVRLSIGDEVEVRKVGAAKGIVCKLTYINHPKKRLSLTYIEPKPEPLIVAPPSPIVTPK